MAWLVRWFLGLALLASSAQGYLPGSRLPCSPRRSGWVSKSIRSVGSLGGGGLPPLRADREPFLSGGEGGDGEGDGESGSWPGEGSEEPLSPIDKFKNFFLDPENRQDAGL